jgi:hypothetical protein
LLWFWDDGTGGDPAYHSTFTGKRNSKSLPTLCEMEKLYVLPGIKRFNQQFNIRTALGK